MYIAILDMTTSETQNREILGLYRDLNNAKALIRRLADNLHRQRSGFWENPDEKMKRDNCIDLVSGDLSLRYWILEEEVADDEELN